MSPSNDHASFPEERTNRRSSQNVADVVTPTRHGATVVTVLDQAARNRVEVCARGAFSAFHADSISDAMRAVREPSVRALLLSLHVLDQQSAVALRILVARNPSVQVAAIVSTANHTPERLLDLGACGIRYVLDLGQRNGWNKLRELVDEVDDEVATQVLGAVLPALAEASNAATHFMNILVRKAPKIASVKTLASTFGVLPSTFLSRFFRARLPSPKRYLATTRLLYASAYFEASAVSIAAVALRLEYSSPQSFGRHVHGMLGVTAGKMRRTYTFNMVLQHYLSHLIQPFESKFRWFDPFGANLPGLSPGIWNTRKESANRAAERLVQ